MCFVVIILHAIVVCNYTTCHCSLWILNINHKCSSQGWSITYMIRSGILNNTRGHLNQVVIKLSKL